jgi:sugar phosphate isomerase/epimerase
MEQSRRNFIRTASAATAGVVLSPNLLTHGKIQDISPNPISVFTKCLQFLDYDQLGETLANVGFLNAELSVRKGGHVLPENVKNDLPKAVKSLRKSVISVPLMVTDITGVDSPEAELVIRTASEMGIRYYRMGYLKYEPAISVTENIQVHRRALDKLEKLNRKYRITGCYQNHSGTNIGGPVWDLYMLVKGFDPEFTTVQYDIRHAVCEGGVSWPLGMQLLSPWIKTTAIKDFYWKKGPDGKWKITNVPLGEGMVDFDAYIEEYKKQGISGPVTIHYEYDLGGAQSGMKNPTMSREKISEFMKTDLNWLRNKFKEHGLVGLYS